MTTPTLYPYQVEGVRWLRERPRAILGDEMGLGKTAQVLTATRLPLLVICPASVRGVWESEVALWRPGTAVDVIETGKHEYDRAADVFVISYDLFGKVRLPKPAQIVCDEAHYLQGRESRRTRAVTAAAGEVNRAASLPVWFLTGTPVWSRPRSLFPLIKLCGRWKAGYGEYAVRYCGAFGYRNPDPGRGVWDDSGATNLDELRERLAPVLLRRRKVDVLKDLPSKRRQVVRVYAEISKAEKELERFDAQTVVNRGLPPGPIATAIRETGMLKVPSICDHLDDVLTNEEKIVVFAWNVDVIYMIRQHCLKQGYRPVSIEGSTPRKQRDQAVADFQGDPEVRVFIGQTMAAGTGLTLTAASTVIFAQPDWTPAVLMQAEDRVHRIGQPLPVLVQYIVTHGSIEETMLNLVLRKLTTAARVLGDR